MKATINNTSENKVKNVLDGVDPNRNIVGDSKRKVIKFLLSNTVNDFTFDI